MGRDAQETLVEFKPAMIKTFLIWSLNEGSFSTMSSIDVLYKFLRCYYTRVTNLRVDETISIELTRVCIRWHASYPRHIVSLTDVLMTVSPVGTGRSIRS